MIHFDHKKIDWWAILGFIILVIFVWIIGVTKARASFLSDYNIYRKFYPIPPAMAYKFGIYHDGPFEVAKVFGRIPGCSDEDEDYIKFVSSTAIRHSLDPRILAATIGIESHCNPLAISNRGALGSMQIMVPIWKDKFDFSNINLLNEHDNIETGAQILSDSIRNYGLNDGIRRYQGIGTGQYVNYDYTNDVLKLSKYE